MERQLSGRVLRQFGQRQGLPSGSGEYARVVRERYLWGPMLPYDQALAEFCILQARPRKMRSGVVDVGVSDEYIQYIAAHPIPQISDSVEPIPSFEEERRQGRRRGGSHIGVRGRGDGGGGDGGGGDGG